MDLRDQGARCPQAAVMHSASCVSGPRACVFGRGGGRTRSIPHRLKPRPNGAQCLRQSAGEARRHPHPGASGLCRLASRRSLTPESINQALESGHRRLAFASDRGSTASEVHHQRRAEGRSGARCDAKLSRQKRPDPPMKEGPEKHFRVVRLSELMPFDMRTRIRRSEWRSNPGNQLCGPGPSGSTDSD